MEERESAKLILSHAGLTFNKDLIQQNFLQNYVNGSYLFKRNKLNIPKPTHELVKDYPTLRKLSNPYIDSLIKLNPNKINLKANPIPLPESQPKTPPFVNISKLSNLALSLNNPYFYNQQETFYKQNEINSNSFNIPNEKDVENTIFLILLNDLKTLYVGPSFTDKINESRSNKINMLIDYFSNMNEENDLKLDDKGCLVYKNLSTNTKFAVYVDYFIKYPTEIRSKSLPLYFRELFLDKILNSQAKFSPTIHYTPRARKLTKKRKLSRSVNAKDSKET